MSMISASLPARLDLRPGAAGRVYEISHRTRYRYAAPVALSLQWLHLRPRDLPWQRGMAYELTVTPEPSRQSEHTDVFGNAATLLELERVHRELDVSARMQVSLGARPGVVLDHSPAWEDVARLIAFRPKASRDDSQMEALRFAPQSPHARIKNVLGEYARQDFLPGRPLLDAAHALMRRIHAEFVYDPEATRIGTPVLELLECRRGVCQDYAHFMIACLRSIGLSARYVSGYLRTHVVPGAAALVGADASHAWVSVYCPRQGWVDFDPTNDVQPDLDHITLGWGRDFGDVSPLRGVILGGGEHVLDVRVKVVERTPPLGGRSEGAG